MSEIDLSSKEERKRLRKLVRLISLTGARWEKKAEAAAVLVKELNIPGTPDKFQTCEAATKILDQAARADYLARMGKIVQEIHYKVGDKMVYGQRIGVIRNIDTKKFRMTIDFTGDGKPSPVMTFGFQNRSLVPATETTAHTIYLEPELEELLISSIRRRNPSEENPDLEREIHHIVSGYLLQERTSG